MNSNNHIKFRKVMKHDKELVKKWRFKPHVKEYWDNNPGMWENFENYLLGETAGFDYWIGWIEGNPFALLITSDAKEPDPQTHRLDEHRSRFSAPVGTTLLVDLLISEENYLGKGLGALTLKAFADSQPKYVTALMTDPATTDAKAIHIYEKAGFAIVDTFYPLTGQIHTKIPHHLMKLNIKHE